MTDPIHGYGGLCIPLVGVAAHTGGDIAAMLNPEGEDLIITRATLYVTTQSTGAANLNVGIGTSATEHDQTEILNALAVGGATGLAYNCFACGDAADALVIWPDDGYLVVNASATSVGLVAKLFIEYLHT